MIASHVTKETNPTHYNAQPPIQDAVEEGVTAVELDNQDQYYVGYGGFPNAAGEMELDAAIMEGTRRCVRAGVARVGSDFGFRLFCLKTRSTQHHTT